MKALSPQRIDSVNRLLAREMRTDPEPAAAAVRLYEKLLFQLSPLIGATGVQELITRSAQLARREHPCLQGLCLCPTARDAEVLSRQLRECLQEQEHPIAREAAEALFGHFFLLLATFIGERLSAQLLHETWPEVPESGPLSKG